MNMKLLPLAGLVLSFAMPVLAQSDMNTAPADTNKAGANSSIEEHATTPSGDTIQSKQESSVDQNGVKTEKVHKTKVKKTHKTDKTRVDSGAGRSDRDLNQSDRDLNKSDRDLNRDDSMNRNTDPSEHIQRSDRMQNTPEVPADQR